LPLEMGARFFIPGILTDTVHNVKQKNVMLREFKHQISCLCKCLSCQSLYVWQERDIS